MEYSNQIVVSDGTLQLVSLTFPYIDKVDVHVSVDFGDGPEEYAPGTIWDWVGSEAIRFDEPLPDGAVAQLQRQTEIGDILNKFTLGAMFNAPTLDENFDQLLYIAQEYSDVREAAGKSLRVPSTEAPVAALPGRSERAGKLVAFDSAGEPEVRQDIRDWVVRASPEDVQLVELPSAEDRANKLLAFDSAGQPTAEFPVADSATELRVDLANPDKGAAMVARGVVVLDSVSKMLALPEGFRKADLEYRVKSYYGPEVDNPGWAVMVPYVDSSGGGVFDFIPGDTTPADGFMYFGDGAGRFKRRLEGAATPEMAGAMWGAGFDSGPALRRISSYFATTGGGRVEMCPVADYHCSSTGESFRPGVFVFEDNVHLEGNGAAIRTNETVTEFNYSILHNRFKRNCSARNLRLYGNATYASHSGEWGHGINSMGSIGWECENIECFDMGGDAIYIGAHQSADPTTLTRNLRLINITGKNCRRQGMSVVSVDGLYGWGLDFSDIGGTAPEAGIDFEPNTPEQQLSNIRLQNVKVASAQGAGVYFYFNRMDASSRPVDIEIDGLSVVGARACLAFHRGNGGATGSIRFSGIVSLSGGVQRELEFTDFSGVDVTFGMLNVNTELSEPVIIGAEGGLPTVGSYVSDLEIKELNLKSTFTDGPYAAGVKVRGVQQASIKNVKIGIGSMSFAHETTRPVWLDTSSPIKHMDICNNRRGALLRTITSNYVYNPAMHYPEYVIAANFTHMTVSSIRPGIPMKVSTRYPGAQLRLPAGSGLRFAPGGAVDAALTLTDVGAYVVVEKDVEDVSLIHIRGGAGYSTVAPA